MNNVKQFSKNMCIGEVINTSLNFVTVAIWPNKEITFGSFILIEKNLCQTLGVVTDIWQEPILTDRQILPLQLSTKEIQSHYPHLSTELILKARIAIVGEMYQDKLFTNKNCSTLHSWIKELQISEKNISLIFECLEKFNTLEIAANQKLFLLRFTAINILGKFIKNDQKLINRLYVIASKLLNNDFFELSSLFFEIDQLQ